MRHHRVSQKHKGQPHIAERQHLALAVLIDQSPHCRRGQGDQRLVYQHQNHRRMHGHRVDLDQCKNRKGNKHLLAEALKKIQRVIQAISPLEHKPALVGRAAARREQNGKASAHSRGAAMAIANRPLYPTES